MKYTRNVVRGRWGRARFSVLTVMVAQTLLVQPVATRACDALRTQSLYNNELAVDLAKDWRITQTNPNEDFLYLVEGRLGKVFAIDLGNNRHIDVGPGAVSSETMINGSPATEYRKNGSISDIVVRPVCGGFFYAWLHVITSDRKERARAIASMKTMRCLVSPRPQASPGPPS
jgi:hypothetical protein